LSALALAAAGAPLILSAPAAHAAAAGTRASHLVVADYGIDKIHKESGSNPDASEYPHGGILAVDASNAAQALIAKDGLMHTPRGIAYDADGDLLVADQWAFNAPGARSGGGVIKIDRVTGAQTAVTSAQHLKHPSGLAVESDGDILVVDDDLDYGAGGVVRVGAVDHKQTVVSKGGAFGNPEGIALEADGTILVIDPDAAHGAGALFRVDPVGGDQTILSKGDHFGNPSGVAVESDGDILVVDPDLDDGAGGVVRINPTNGDQTVLSKGDDFGNPTGIAVDTDGSILVADPDAFGKDDGSDQNGAVFRVDPGTGVQTVVSSDGGFRDPAAVLPAQPSPIVSTGISASDVVVADTGTDKDISATDDSPYQSEYPHGGIFAVDRRTGAQAQVTKDGLMRNPRAIAYNTDGDLLVADKWAFSQVPGSRRGGGVISIDRVSGAQSVVTSAQHLKHPTGLAVEPDGDILVVDADLDDGAGGVVRVDPVTNRQTVVSEDGNFGNPEGIALEPDGNILVVDPDLRDGAAGVVRVNPTTGAQTVLSQGGNFGNPSGIAVEADGDILVVDPDLTNGAGGVVRIPKAGGAQEVLASGGKFANPVGISVDTDGSILVADPDALPREYTTAKGAIFRLDLVTRDLTVVSSQGWFRRPAAVLPARPAPVVTEATTAAGYQPAVFTQNLNRAPCATDTYTVPAGTTRLGFQVIGAAGRTGADDGGSGGLGALVTGTLKVEPGEKLYVNAGVNLTGGFPDGGGGRGGNMSFISSDPASGHLIDLGVGALFQRGCNTSDFLVVAGGGGGGGDAGGSGGGDGGDAAGWTGSNGHTGIGEFAGRGGAGGTQSDGGKRGPTTCKPCHDGRTGVFQVGGDVPSEATEQQILDFVVPVVGMIVANSPVKTVQAIYDGSSALINAESFGGGGGGGGGYYGGGSGGTGDGDAGGGGGAGSSYVDPDRVISGAVNLARSADTRPSVTLTPLNDANGAFGTGLTGDYYDNADLTGHTMTRVDPQVNFDWGNGAPDHAMGPDGFSTRWTGQVLAPETGTYTFATNTDDGVRVWVDNQLVIDKWQVQQPTDWTGSIDLQAGQKYPIRMEYYDNTAGAKAKLSWKTPSASQEEVIPSYRLYPDSPPASGLTGSYYDNADLTGKIMSRVDPTVDFDWGNGSPDKSIDPDTFSVRWTGQVYAPDTGTYTFSTNSDDGVRLWVDNKLIIDHWQVQSEKKWSATIDLQAGQNYPIRLDYYDNTAGAKAQLIWDTPSGPEHVIPSYRLSPR
jgi:DNA-binding beta-propeller fold protein YncE